MARKTHTYRAAARNKARVIFRHSRAERLARCPEPDLRDIVDARTISAMMDAFRLRDRYAAGGR
jgi:hypothetical protein